MVLKEVVFRKWFWGVVVFSCWVFQDGISMVFRCFGVVWFLKLLFFFQFFCFRVLLLFKNGCSMSLPSEFLLRSQRAAGFCDGER